MIKKIGLMLMLCSLILVAFYYTYQYSIQKKNEDDINTYIEETKNQDVVIEESEPIKQETKKEMKKINYTAVLEIPSIKLKQGIINVTSNFESINYAVSADKKGSYPDQKGNFILYAHSGNSRIAYFDNLYKVNIEDDIYVYYNGIKYHYSIFDKYNIEKNGKLNILSTTTNQYITLVTCNQQDRNKQIVIVGKLINQVQY